MSADFDVCVIGSGAGGGPMAYELALAGHSVVVLEKGPWLRENDFYKDDLACCRRDVYTPLLREEQHVLEERDSDQRWQRTPTSVSGRSFWNGSCVGGSSNFMSGYFHRLKPVDFRLLSAFGPIAGANIVDWPIGYDDLEPYYEKVERVVGVSGRAAPGSRAEPRSTDDFPYPPTAEHPVSAWIDQACEELGFHSLRVPRAILSEPALGRRSCEYSGYCGSYGCASGAKGSARAALLDRAVATGRCEIRAHAKVSRLASDPKGRILHAEYFDGEGRTHRVDARIYVVACQAVETARLLLASAGPKCRRGLANNQGQVGRDLIFSAGGSGSGDLAFDGLDPERIAEIRLLGPFVNRALDDWYVIEDKQLGRIKGGIVELLWSHPNAFGRAFRAMRGRGGRLLWGTALKRNLELWFRQDRTLNFEVFNDWLPTDDCFVALDDRVEDKWGSPVARIRLGAHPHDLKVGRYLAEKGEQLLGKLGAVRIGSSISSSPPPNLVAGGCRFGTDPSSSVLDPDCRTHEVENLFVTDGSFMPTGGSVPFTWTIYANAFRVADQVKAQLGAIGPIGA